MTAIATFDTAFLHTAALVAALLAGCAVVAGVASQGAKPKAIPVRVRRDKR